VKVEIVERPSVAVASFRHTGPYGAALGRFWRNTVTPVLAEHGMLDCPRYGVPLDDAAHTPPETCRYDACIELPAGLALPGAESRTIPGGQYAVARFKGTSAEIGAAWDAFVGVVLSGTSGTMDPTRYPFEHYPRGATFDPKTGIFTCELCLPL